MDPGLASISGTLDYTVVLPPAIIKPPNAESALNEGTTSSATIDFQSSRSPHAEKFKELRTLCDLDEESFLNSIKMQKGWNAKGGKSKTSFVKTMDEIFVIKEITQKDYRHFVDDIGVKYFDYLEKCRESNEPTCIAKIFGIYKVKNHLNKTKYWIVMENITAGKGNNTVYDIKGKLGRNVVDTEDQQRVRFEEEFIMDVKNHSLYINQASKEVLQRALLNDTKFLKDVNVMDYSLLVWIDNETQQMHCGVIDYLGSYDFAKMLECFVKSLLIACVCNDQLPTVVKPTTYQSRFIDFINNEFK
ncbi:putative 1-phosphatidylinositol-3-phosphate 5-kinase FAB1D [Cardamine amara subsp. amara]|uniref:1-phosphatidylinositol-3-phosphate 5-kinase FAB1D n=1 Tax=Cardamine amara subsp. amara TaxID=228776 RepID=A0ABD0ZMZ0_CARAN